jgi:AraC family transcriptional regulator of adaptative response/methylated-DNA-[protein]-cysteine methyltransferase
MITAYDKKQEYYAALVKKDPTYDGIFFAGIKTTGIFCHATCTARKPKFENCEFFESAQEALLSGFRPCKICQPLSYPQAIPSEIKQLVLAVEACPEKRWTEKDFHELGLHSATVRRKFKEIYGMTFVQYARARRMGLAFQQIITGAKVIDEQLAAGYASASSFNDAFSKILGNPPTKATVSILYANLIMTPIGRMLSISDDHYLYLLEFMDRKGLEREIERLRIKQNCRILPGVTVINQQLERQLDEYFKHDRLTFSIPLRKFGSPFQQTVWEALTRIPAGKTATYQEIAFQLGNPKAVRAVGNANGANQLAILIPCHRVINTNGSLGGYGGGLERKHYLLTLEKKKTLQRSEVHNPVHIESQTN